MINVKDHGAVGDGVTDDTNALESAIAAGGQEAVYLPMGVYKVHHGLNVTGRQLVGEPYLSAAAGSGSIVKMGESIEGPDSAVLWSGRPDEREPCPKRALGSVRVTNVAVDADENCDHGVLLRGATGTMLSGVASANARLDGFLFDGCQGDTFTGLTAVKSGRHGINFVDCNGSNLRAFACSRSGLNNADGSGIRISNECHSGGVAVAYGSIEAGHGPALVLVNRSQTDTPCSIERLWIESHADHDPIVLDGSRDVTIERCRITGGVGGDEVVAIRLRNGAFNNVVKDNAIAIQSDPLPGSGGLTTGDRIVVEEGCANNHISGNVSLRKSANAVFVDMVDRNHVVGQRRVMAYEDAPPSGGTWAHGDIVWNANPTVGAHVGWVNVHGGWRPFGRIDQ